MMKYIYTIIAILALAFVSCNRTMDDINTNPDTTATAPPSYFVTNLTLAMAKDAGVKAFMEDQWAMKTVITNEMAQTQMYNSIGSYDINYLALLDATSMVKEAAKFDQGVQDTHQALNQFTRAWLFYNTTIRLGDVPCSEAALPGIVRPKYDTQEAVFETIIKSLDDAASLFSKGVKFSGDVVYNGDPKRWEKASNSLLLRVLMHLSTKKTTVGSINVKAKFEEVAKRPLIASNAEDFQMVYSDKGGQYYPYSKKQHIFSNNIYMHSYIIDMLKKYSDKRIFYYAEPSSKAIADGIAATDFAAYQGVDGTQPFTPMKDEVATGKISRFNTRYTTPVGEPVKALSYAEVQFILAEAALLGWATPEPAKEHYEKAVTAAIEFTVKYTPTEHNHGVTIAAADISTYLGSGSPANWDAATNKLELLMEQKYIAGFIQTLWNSYFDYRRTGYPKIPINPATSNNTDYPDRMPVRFTYASIESSSNFVNYDEAVKRQFGTASQTQNDVIWLLK